MELRNLSTRVDLYDPPRKTECALKQFDETSLSIRLMTSQGAYIIPRDDDVMIVINVVLPDESAVIIEDDIEVEKPNIINVKLKSVVVSLSGTVMFEIVILKNGKQISSYPFTGIIKPAALDCMPIISEDISGNIYKALAIANIASIRLREQTNEAQYISDNIETYLKAVEDALEQTKQYDANASESMRQAAQSALESLNSANDSYKAQKASEKARDEITIMHDAVVDESREVAENLDKVKQIATHVEEVSANTDNVIATVLADAAYAKHTAIMANTVSLENASEIEEIKKILAEYKFDVNDFALYQDPVTNFVYVLFRGEAGQVGIPLAGGTGGGGTGGVTYSIVLTNLLPNRNISVAQGTPVILNFLYTSTDKDGIPDGSGICTVYVGGVAKAAFNVPQGENSIDIAQHLVSGENRVNIKVENTEGASRLLTYTINVIALNMSTTLDKFSVNTGDVTFYFTPTGSGVKTIHFLMDGVELDTIEILSSGRSQTYNIPAQPHGGHIFTSYAETMVGDVIVRSNVITLGMLWIDKNNMTPVIVSIFDVEEATQGETLTIPYFVYDPSTESASVTLSIIDENNNVFNSQTLIVGRTAQEWIARDYPKGHTTFKLSVGAISVTEEVFVSESGIVFEIIQDSLDFNFNADGRSNNEENPAQWTDGKVSADFNNVNFLGVDGWLTDKNGGRILRLLPGAEVTIPKKLFEGDKRISGATIEVEMATHNVTDYYSVVMSCLSGGRGFKIASQYAQYNSEQSMVSMQFREDARVRVTFVIESRNLNRLIFIFVNGIISGAIQYPENDNFAQSPPVGITIGAEASGIDIYRILFYNKGLTRNEIINNYTADRTTLGERIDTFKRNDILDISDDIVISKLPIDCPYMIIDAAELPQFKGDKKTCNITYVDQSDPSKSFTASGVTIDVQGTSSAGYKKKNFTITFANGLTYTFDGTNATKYKLRDNSIPVNLFTMKADVASSEGFNNVGLVGFYNDVSPYKTNAQKADPRVRVGIDGLPTVIFWQNSKTADVRFWGKYNFNNDKGNHEVYGLVPGCESWETLNNTSDRVIFKKSEFASGEWLNDFEARYPKGNLDYTKFKRMTDWVVSTDRNAVSEDSEKQARLNKFKNEFDEYFVKEPMLLYYLFTEVFLMVDSRAKNFFPSTFDGVHWMPLPYDCDTALGINNEGQLAFGYHLEDTDKVGGANVFNGQDSVLWNNVRDAFPSEIASLYATLRSGSLFNYTELQRRFSEHQSVWPEVVWNEDAYEKYLEPLITDGDGAYLTMLQGSKESQRSWWLYYGFRYRDSKYQTGDASSQFITLRCYAAGNIKIIPYIHIYVRVKFGSYNTHERGQQNVETEVICPIPVMNDTEVYIYSADCISTIGDLSHLHVGYANFSMATKLQKLKLGDSSASYQNTRLTDLYVGNNQLLTEVDVSNCINLTQAVDLSGCTGIEIVRAKGSSVTGFNLPIGGKLKTLILPGTITNLTIRDQIRFELLQIENTDSLTTLRLENTSSIPVENIILSAPVLDRVRLINMEWNATNETNLQSVIAKLKGCVGLDAAGNNTDSAVVTGRVYISSVSAELLTEINEAFPQLIVVAAGVPQYVVRYLNYDGTVLYRMVVPEGANVVNAVTAGFIDAPTRPGTEDTGWQFKDFGVLPTNVRNNITVIAQFTGTFRVLFMNDTVIFNTQWVVSGNNATTPAGTPTRASTAQYTYTFSGWDKPYTNITAPLIVNAKFTSTVRTYTVYFYNGTTLLQTVLNVPYGGSATFTGATPISPEGTPDDYPFIGWSPPPTNITGNTSCYAQFDEPSTWGTKITDTWEEIIAAVNDGTATSKYEIGDYKALELGSEGVVNMQIIGKNMDNLADGSGTATLTWLSIRLLKNLRRMNPALSGTSPNLVEGTGTIGGWEKSELRAYLKDTIEPLIPENVRNAIKPILKNQTAHSTSNQSFLQTTEDDVWIPSTAEVSSAAGLINQPRYDIAFPDSNSRIKKRITSSSASNWWLRGISASYFTAVGSNGSVGGLFHATSNYGIALGFCF